MAQHTQTTDPATIEQALAAFREKIALQEDILYGLALFFECLNVLHSEQAGVVETYRKEFRNIIQKGAGSIETANHLLDEVRTNPARLAQLQQFRFDMCSDHSDPNALCQRARTMVDTYNRVFPNRPRSQDLTADETLKLIDEASGHFQAT